MEPKTGQIYRSPNGDPMLFVRGETRQEGAGFMFMSTSGGVIYTRFAMDVPPEWKLVNDHVARADATRLEGEMAEAKADREALVATLKRAVAMVPPAAAEELRALYANHGKEAAAK